MPDGAGGSGASRGLVDEQSDPLRQPLALAVDRLAQGVDPQVDLRGPVEQLGAHVGHHRLRQLVDAPLEPTETVANPSTGEQGADQAAERAHRVGCSTSLGRRSSMPAS